MRLFPRVKTDLSTAIEDAALDESGGVITDLSLDGAFIKGRFSSVAVGDTVFFKSRIPGYGTFEHSGKAIRKTREGVAVTFYDLDFVAKARLWEYIGQRLRPLDACPYCGQKYSMMPAQCVKCGWKLEFHSPLYLEYHEKTYLLKRLYSRAENLAGDQIRRTIDFIDREIQVGKDGEEFREFIGSCQAMQDVFSRIRKVAATEVPVLILGESGTGKELTALAIHKRSPRKDGPFVAVNCAATPENLLEPDLFGYEKGAYVGADSQKMGKFEYADGGTLFLEEVGELSPPLQVRLLRFLENQVVERIGMVRGKKVNVRLIVTAGSDLQTAMEQGRFRRDLYYRLEAFTLKLPPVRERGEDKSLLARYFLKKYSHEMGVSKEFTDGALRAIENYPFPGNVREISNKVKKAIVLSSGPFVAPRDLDIPFAAAIGAGEVSSTKRKKIEKQKLVETLQLCRHNISKAARILGVSRPTVYSLLKKYGLNSQSGNSIPPSQRP